jgi:hypothetical protein
MDPLILTIARDLGVSAETLRKWRQRRTVPHHWRLPLLRAAARRGVFMDASVFDRFAGPKKDGNGGNDGK